MYSTSLIGFTYDVRFDVSTYFQENGLTPLMIAVKENKLVIVERLMELGVNLNDRAKVHTETYQIWRSVAQQIKQYSSTFNATLNEDLSTIKTHF